jgi:hypothetical protein
MLSCLFMYLIWQSIALCDMDQSRPQDLLGLLYKEPHTFIRLFSLLLCVVNNRALFKNNSEIYNINTKYGFNFHCPHVHLTTYKNVAYYIGIKVFNCLPTDIQIYLIMLINLNWLWGIYFIIIQFTLQRNTLSYVDT